MFITILSVTILAGLAYFAVPKPRLLSNFTFSSAVYDRNGKLLRLSLSNDDKYRLYVSIAEVPENFKKVLLLYEDRNFYYHPGVDPSAIVRAMINTFGKGRKQGGSTVTMQLARLVFNLNTGTVLGKMEQMLRAVQIEMFYSKDEILEAYFNLSPYGYNVEGIAAAGLVYFGRDISKLSLPEILALTVVPQNPTKRNPGTSKGFVEMKKSQERLAEIWRMEYPDDNNNKYLDMPITANNIRDLPFIAPHFTTNMMMRHRGKIETTLDAAVQKDIEEITRKYVGRNRHKGIYNASILLLDYEKMEVLAHLGSVDFANDKILGQVDGTMAQRSPGSALKPFIYAQAMEKGIIHPLTMLKDLPKNYGFYTPENFDRSYTGILSASDALIFSRNVPAVELLLKTGTAPFYSLLQQAGVRNLKDEGFYGLALALGGFEISLYETAGLYAMLANLGLMQKIKTVTNKYEHETDSIRAISQESAFLTLQMLARNQAVDSPDLPIKPSGSKYPVYWKTGTSYGFKDALTAGIFGSYVLIVWVGNFDATPNHSFVGRRAAAPLFFEIVRSMEKRQDFYDHEIKGEHLDIAKVDICKITGDIANSYCPEIVSSWFIPGVSPIKMSNVHRRIPIDRESGLRACRHTPPSTELKVFEFWPSDVRNVFAAVGIHKKQPPDFLENCRSGFRHMQGKVPVITYPVADITYIVRYHRLEKEKIPLKASVDPDAKRIYWFVDDSLVGETKPDETLEIKPRVGSSLIKAIDDLGRESHRKITVQVKD